MNPRAGSIAIAALMMVSQVAQGAAPPPDLTKDPRCTDTTEERGEHPNGPELWGMFSKDPVERRGLFDKVLLGGGRRGTQDFSLTWKGHVLVAKAGGPEALGGATLQAMGPDGKRLVIVVCGVEHYRYPDGEMVPLYKLRYHDDNTRSWHDVCFPTQKKPNPGAIALPGVWDDTGQHRDSQTAFTFACEGGAIGKCATELQYRPWQDKDGRSLGAYHLACTHMVRADYCGHGITHTRRGVVIDAYDDIGVQTRTAGSDAQMSFEAAWGPDGAQCLRRSRFNEPLEGIIKDCPQTFVKDTVDLGGGDVCVYRRANAKPGGVPFLIRNRS